MERDFTSECYNDFCTLADEVKDDCWLDVGDWFGDCFVSLKHLLQDWGWLDRTTEINTYYRELLELEVASKDTITQIFEAMSDLDTYFAGLRYFSYCKNYMDTFRQCLSSLSNLASQGASAKNEKEFASNIFHPKRISSVMGPSLKLLRRYPSSEVEIDSLPKPEYQFSPSTFSEISQADKKSFVRRCDTLCPNLAEAVNGLFTDPDWTEQEKLDIKFIIYNASEPYRSIFLKNALCCNTVVFQNGSKDSDDNDNSCFANVMQKVYLLDGDSTFRDNERAPYNTVFHEYGHAVDSAVYTKESYLSSFFWVGEDNLQYCILEDVRNYVNQKIDSMCAEDYNGLTAEQKQLLLDKENRNTLLANLNLTGDSKPYGGSDKGLPEELEIHRNLIKRDIASALSGETNCAASDVYGGITNNAIGSAYGHKGEKYEFYWYHENGLPTNYQAAELWAEFFAAQMTHDEESLASIKAHFPTAYPLLEEMALQLDPLPMAPT